MDTHQVERNKLAEDEEKLQLALQATNANDEFGWYDYDDVDDEDDEQEDSQHLLIDLETPSDTTAQSTSSGYVESGSRGHFMSVDEDSQERRAVPPGLSFTTCETTGINGSEKTLALNRALQGILESRIESIQAALEINKEKRLRLNDGTWAELESKKAGKGRTWGPFRSPYFETKVGYLYPPDNPDTITKRQTNELPYASMSEHMQYNAHTKRVLTQAIVEDTRELLMKPVMNRLEVEVKKAVELRRLAEEKADDIANLKKRLKEMKQNQYHLTERLKFTKPSVIQDNEDEMEEIKQEMAKEEMEFDIRQKVRLEQDSVVATIEDELSEVKGQTDRQVLDQVDSSKVDWMKLSKLWFKDGTSWVDCQKAWDFMVDPNINLKPWSKEEETRLLEMVNSSDTNRDWQEIATQLGQ